MIDRMPVRVAIAVGAATILLGLAALACAVILIGATR